jgi:hypothetical protein
LLDAASPVVYPARPLGHPAYPLALAYSDHLAYPLALVCPAHDAALAAALAAPVALELAHPTLLRAVINVGTYKDEFNLVQERISLCPSALCERDG